MSKCKITGKVLAIQLGRENTQIVLMGKGKEILHSVCIETPAGAVEDGMIRNADAVRTMLQTALKQEPAFKHVNQAVFTLCTSQVVSEVVTTPNLSDSKLEKLLQSNVDMYFPVDMRDYQLVWQTIGPQVKETGLKELAVQLWAVPTAMLARYYSVANACGLSVAAVDYCGHSIASAAGVTFSRNAKAQKKSGRAAKKEVPADETEESLRHSVPTDLHLTLDKDLLGMTFVQEGTVVFQRFIRCGSDPSHQLGELAMMVEYFRSLDVGRGAEINPIASGALSGYLSLMDELEDTLGMPVAGFGSDYDPGLAMCVGAASTTLDFGTPALNKPGKARRELRSQLWQYGLILVGGLVLMLSVMTLLSSRIAWSTSIGSLENTRQMLTIQSAQTAGFADNYYAYSDKYDAYSADWDTVFSSLRTYNDNLVLVLDELEDTLPENTSVTGLQIAANGLNVQFACATKEEAAYLIMALRELQYADLVGITDLMGGGIGPATSYGSEETEEAPTEGSSAGEDEITKLVASELTKEELAKLGKSLTPAQIKLLEQCYGKDPVTMYPSLARLKELHADTEPEFYKLRCDAVREMLTTNPFTANRFGEMLLEDFERGNDSILLIHVMADMMKLQKEGKLNMDNLGQSMDVLVDLLTKNETNLTATEDLFCTDEKMESWYLYYLEVEMGVQYGTKLPFLDMHKVAADLMDGYFNTGDPDLDAKLNALISDSTRNLLISLSSPEKMGKMVTDYFTKGSSGSPVVDALINSYLTTGSTGIPAVDREIEAYIASGALNDTMASLVNKYLTTGTTGNTVLDQMIQNYLNKGTTGNKDLDAIIAGCIGSGTLDKVLTDMFTNYLTTGTTGNSAMDKMAEQYLATGSTGNAGLDKVINDYIRGGGMTSTLAVLATKYLTTGTTGNKALDTMLMNYQTKGTTGNKAFDALLERFFPKDEPTEPSEPTEPMPDLEDPGYTDAQVAQLLEKYLTTGTTGDKTGDLVMKKYLTEASTGIQALDQKLENRIKSGKADSQLTALLDKFVDAGTTGSNTLDRLVKKYLTTGTTGIQAIDDVFNKYMASGYLSDELFDMMKDYVVSGTSGNATFDSMIKKYIKDGTCGNKHIDNLLKKYFGSDNKEEDKEEDKEDDKVEDPDAEKVAQMAALLKKWSETGTTGNATMDTLFSNYFKNKTTGNKELDTLIKKALETTNIKVPVGGNGSISDALDKLTGNKNNANTAPKEPEDTRIFFTAVLGYNEELQKAELIRKGLNYGDKIDKVEVED